MARFYRLWMDIVSQTDKGFTMLEMLIGLIIISSFGIITLNRYTYSDNQIYEYINNYLLAQSEALTQRKDVYYDKGIYFNSMGHVNQARTLNFKNHKLIIHLGNGYVTYE